MKKIFLILFGPPLFLMSGLVYVIIGQFLTRDREPWFTLCLVGGLATTVALITWCAGIPLAWALWTFAIACGMYLGLCLLFGGNRVEALVPVHMLVILAMIAWPTYEKVRMKAVGKPIPDHYQTSTSSSSCAAGAGAGLTKS